MASKTKVKDPVLTEDGVSSDVDSKTEPIRRIISQASKWRQKPYRDDDELEERCELFINLVSAKDPPELPTAEALAMFLGISFHKLRKMTRGEGCSERAQTAVQKVITWESAIWGQASIQSIFKPANYIWYSKNWFEMREPDARLTLNLPSPLKELPSIEQLEEKYAEIPEAK